jgi:hypothetical protein
MVRTSNEVPSVGRVIAIGTASLGSGLLGQETGELLTFYAWVSVRSRVCPDIFTS